MKNTFNALIAVVLTASVFTATPAAVKSLTPETSTVAKGNVTHLYDTNDGSVGRLTIGGYTAELYNSNSQSVVDAADSAAYFAWGNNTCIADHAYQGLSIIRSLGAGATATITDNSTVTYLTMIASYQGTNTGHGVNLADGTYAESVNASYCMYTCNDADGVSVTVTYWNVTGTGAVAPVAPVAPAAPAVVESAPVAQTAQISSNGTVAQVAVSADTESAQEAVVSAQPEHHEFTEAEIASDEADIAAVDEIAENEMAEAVVSEEASLENQNAEVMTAQGAVTNDMTVEIAGCIILVLVGLGGIKAIKFTASI